MSAPQIAPDSLDGNDGSEMFRRKHSGNGRTESPTLEDLHQLFADTLTNARRAFWLQARIIADVLDRHESRRHKRAAAGTLASIARCSRAHILQLDALARHYSGDTEAHPATFTLLRACIHAALRTGRHAEDVLHDALDGGWNVAEVDALGKPVTRRGLALDAKCNACGLEVSVRITFGPFQPFHMRAGAPIACPGCACREGAATLLGVLA